MERAKVMSRHARQRSQQRGVPFSLIEAILDHCDRDSYIGDNCRVMRVSRAAARSLSRSGGDRQLAERLPNLVLVWSDRNNQVVTVIHDNGNSASRRYRVGA